jgi:hypothetical protein
MNALHATSRLPFLDCETTAIAMPDLPPLLPHFFVPRLVDKPQDPIMDTLRGTVVVKKLLEERRFPALMEHMVSTTSPQGDRHSIWFDAATLNTGERVKYDLLSCLEPSTYKTHYCRVRSCHGTDCIIKGVPTHRTLRFCRNNPPSRLWLRDISENPCFLCNEAH